MKVVAARAEHRDALRALFARTGQGCFCRWWHFEDDDKAWLARCSSEPERNENAFCDALRRDAAEARGLVALRDGEAVGWLKLCPAPAMLKLYRSRVYRTLDCFDGDREHALAVACMLVDPSRRRQGIARTLLRAALVHARDWGASCLEATPRRVGSEARADELWLGPMRLFEELGFELVGGEDPYPVLRRPLQQ